MNITSGSNKNHISITSFGQVSIAPVNSYLTRCSWENVHFATTSGNISAVSCGVSLVKTLLLDLLITFNIAYFPGVWLSAFNSVANPFVYALLMPTYRKCVINTFCACLDGSNRKQDPSLSCSDESTSCTHY